MQRLWPARGRDDTCCQPWEPALLLFLSSHLFLLSLTPPISATGAPAQAVVIQESCGELGGGGQRRDKRRCGGWWEWQAAPCSQRGIWRGAVLSALISDADHYFHYVLCPEWSRSSCNWMWSSAFRHNLQSQCVQSRFGQVLVRVFLASQGNDYQSHCDPEELKTTHIAQSLSNWWILSPNFCFLVQEWAWTPSWMDFWC